MELTIHENETAKEAKIRQALQAFLMPGETLLDYSPVEVKLARVKYWLGMTDRRFILIWPKNRDGAYSIYFAFIAEVTPINQEAGSPNPALSVKLRAGRTSPAIYRCTLFTDGGWSPAMQAMAEKFVQLNDLPHRDGMSIVFQQVKDLQAMGLSGAARTLLDGRIKTDPVFAANEDARFIKRQFNGSALGVRVGYVFLTLYFAFLIVAMISGKWPPLLGKDMPALLGGFFTPIVYLLTSKTKKVHLVYTLICLVLLTFTFIWTVVRPATLPLLDAIFCLTFCLSSGLLIVKPDYRCIAVGILVFIIGAGGTVAFAYLAPTYYPQAVDAISFKPSGPFQDDHYSGRSWDTVGSDTFYSDSFAGGGTILVEETPDKIDFAFPPVTYFLGKGEVDVWPSPVAQGDSYEVGGFLGMACLWQNQGARYYAVLFDPLKLQYSIVRKTAEATVLLSGSWLPLTGLKPGNVNNRIGLACEDNKVTVTFNGATLTSLNDPTMQGFGRGQMGVVIQTNQALTNDGFRAEFTNGTFWALK